MGLCEAQGLDKRSEAGKNKQTESGQIPRDDRWHANLSQLGERRIKRRAEIRHQTRFQRKQSKIQSGGDNFGGKYMELNYSVVTRNI